MLTASDCPAAQIIAALLALVLSALASAGPGPEDFAYGMRLEVDPNKPVNMLRIPEQVYHGLVRADMGDLRVFDSKGRALPHSLRAQRVVAEQPMQAWRSLDFAAAPATASQQGGAESRHYVLDLGDASRIETLRITWSESVGTAIGSVRIESSHDLTNWTTLVPGAGIAQLQLGDRIELHNEIRIGGRSRRYLRLHWPESFAARYPTAIEMIKNPDVSKPIERRAAFEPDAIRSEGDFVTIHYKVPAALAVRGFRLDFPATNIMLRGSLEYRVRDSSAWRVCSGGVFYRLTADGRSLGSPRKSCSAAFGGELRLRVKTEHWKSSGEHAPKLVLWWAPHELSFLLQGEAPYTLAWGSGAVEPNPESVNALLGELDVRPSAMLGKARIVEHVSLGGLEQLEIRAEPVAWQRIVLWAVLIIGVLALTGMALSTWRDMLESDESGKSE